MPGASATASASAILGRLRAVANAVPAAVERGLLQAGRIYLADQGRSFDALSAGGGEWPALEPETVRRKGSSRILVATGELRASLNPGHPDNVLEVQKTAGGMVLRAGTKNRKARFHQVGAGHNPVRRVIREPSPQTVAKMRAAVVGEARRAVQQAAKR